jgi:hypothetical protein
MPLDPIVRDKLNRAHPDALAPYGGERPGKATYFRDEIPEMLRAMMGNGRSVRFGAEPPRVDESWVVTMMGEMVPTFVGDLLEGSGERTAATGRTWPRP